MLGVEHDQHVDLNAAPQEALAALLAAQGVRGLVAEVDDDGRQVLGTEHPLGQRAARLDRGADGVL